MRSIRGVGLAIGSLFVVWDLTAAAEVAEAKTSGASATLLEVLSGRLELIISHFPALAAHLARLPDMIGGRTALVLVGMLVAGLAAEYVVRWLLKGVRVRGFDRLTADSALHGFWRAVLFDVLAVAAFWVAGRLVLGQIGDAQSVGGKLGAGIPDDAALLAGLQPRVSRLAAARHAGRPHRAGRRYDRARPAGRPQPE